jgi:superfamily II DNA or RNA helicase
MQNIARGGAPDQADPAANIPGVFPDDAPCGASRDAPPLRPYQQSDIAKIRAEYASGARSVLYQAPTGSGKTRIFSQVVAGAVDRGNRVVILGHRQEIVDQISEALDALGVVHGIIAAGHPEAPLLPVQVASVATLVRRLDRFTGADLLVIDESHHSLASTWREIIAALPRAKILGVTATPERADGQGLGDVFDVLVIGPPVADLIEGGFLAPFVTYAPPRSPDLAGVRSRMGDYATGELSEAMSRGVIIRGAVAEYAERCPGAPAIAFCVDIDHSQRVAAAFRERGYRAAHVDGDTPRDERRALIAALATAELQVLCNCGLISEGLDVPNVIAAIPLFLQQVGRALRPAPGKERAIILDHAGNTYRFGFADTPRSWSLEGRAKGEGGEAGKAPVARCPECGALVPAACFECPECGAELRSRLGDRTEVHRPPLIEAERLRGMTYGQALRWAGASGDRLRLVARARGYKRGWVWHRLQEMKQAG